MNAEITVTKSLDPRREVGGEDLIIDVVAEPKEVKQQVELLAYAPHKILELCPDLILGDLAGPNDFFFC